MSKVYVVVENDYSSCYYEGDFPEVVVHGVFTDKAEAEKCWKKHPRYCEICESELK